MTKPPACDADHPAERRERLRERSLLWTSVSLAVLLPIANHILVGNDGLNMRDEGYLWYGVRAVLAGEVPMRDFQAYDPGRYYWCAALAGLFGDGVVGVRASSASFQVFGLMAGLLAARRVVRAPLALALLALVFALWMFPRHKLYESSITMIGVLAATRLVERPSAGRHLAAGVVIGAMAFFGRNHGLYLSLGLGGLALWLGFFPRAQDLGRRALCLAGGVLLGYAPMLAMMLGLEGFLGGFAHATKLLLEQGANLPEPYPWPWRASLASAAEVGVVLAFLLPIVVYPLALPALIRSGHATARRSPHALLAACFFVGLPYTHHFAVRSDLAHLAQALHPALLLCLALASSARRIPRAARILSWATLLLITGAVQLQRHPWLRERLDEEEVREVLVQVQGDRLRLKFPLARQLGYVWLLVDKEIGDEELFIAPTSPTFYPLLGKRSPDWWIYYLWPAPEAEQRETIRRLEERRIRWALIVHKPFDADTSYALEETNPLVWEYLEREFVRSEVEGVPRDYELFERR